MREARTAANRREVPVGAVVIGPDRRLLGSASNQTERDNDPSAHAELLALRQAATLLRSPRLPECDLYVTLEPCPMCAYAISLFRIRRLVFGAYDPKGGGVEHGPRIFETSSCHHRPEIVGGVRERESSELLKAFFRRLRDENKHKPGQG